MHTTSLPSTELAGQYAGEHTEGAGALPGPVTESEVSKLPDERNATVPTAGTMAASVVGTAAVATGAATGYTYAAAQSAKDTVSGTAQAAKERVTQSAPISGPATTKYSLPSEEGTGAKPFEHTGGVGALPGKKTEAGVATLPDENMRGATFATSAGVGTHGRTFDATTKPTQDENVRDELHQVKGREVTGGVGRLPGMAGEEGVAVLPDERAGAGYGGAGVGATSLPTNETLGAQPYERSDGAGALPGKSSESGVAVAPDQKRGGDLKETAGLAGAGAAAAGMGKWALDDRSKSQQPSKVGEDTHLADSAKSAGAQTAGAPAQAPVKETQKEATKEEGEEKKASHGKPNKGDGYDTNYHPAQIHPPNADYSKEHDEMNKDNKDEGDLTGAKHTDSKEPASTGAAPATAGRDDAAHDDKSQHDNDKDTHPDKTKKVGFMAKMKGEAKVLLGKVERKQEKVEEGQKIKAGETVH